MTSTPGAQIALFFTALVILLGASFAIVRFGKQLRGRVATTERRRPRRASPGTGYSRESHVITKTLKEQGMPPGALAGMSAAEQRFFLETMRLRLGDGTGPRLVRPPAGTSGAAAAAASEAPPAPVPAAALVTGPIHCPVCRAVIGQRSEPGPTMQRCPGCSRRVTTKIDGDRLVVTVSYGLGGTPKGSPTIKGR